MAGLNDAALAALAGEAGLLVEWEGWDGVRRTVSPDTLRAALTALGLPCATETDAAESWARLAAEPPSRIADDTAAALDVAALTGRSKAWGLAAQLYALRGNTPAEIGDFASLVDLAHAAGARGADALAISPVHALFLADPHRFSPYSPSSRDFLNPLFADCGPGRPGDALIDWPEASAARVARLRTTFDRFEGDPAFAAFVAAGGAPLRSHAVFEALHGHFHAQGAIGGWQQWPSSYHDPNGPAVATFARERDREIRFHLFAQWRAATGFGAAQAAAKAAGMGIGLIADLAVGIDPGGSHAWSRRDELLHGLTLGAPPDAFQAGGQGWGITGLSPTALARTGFEPFLRTIRAALGHAGGIRIDHALGLGRLWVIPDGATPLDGVYLRQPMPELLAILATESRRADALVIAEDLGVVPPGIRDRFAERHLLGMRVLPFERDARGRFTDPATWTERAVAMTSTHDLTPIAGWWRGTDIGWRERLGFSGDTPRRRDVDRRRFWRAAGNGPQPAASDPALVVNAAVSQVAQSACELAIVALEDLLGLDEAPNLPGTIDQHPNWRRRLAASPEALFADPAVTGRLATLATERPQ
jgi:4-alpha-glucanotransferase